MPTENQEDAVLNLMARAEHGLQHARDAEILFAALKSAANSHTEIGEYMKFLKFHINKGLEHVRNKSVAH